MKKTIILLASLALALTVQAQSKKEIKANKIKSITVWQADILNEKANGYKDSYEEFDADGHSITSIDYNKDGSIQKKETTTYNANGKKIEETEFDAKENKNLKRTYLYNDKNKKTFGKLFQETQQKRRLILDNGYNLIEKWETE